MLRRLTGPASRLPGYMATVMQNPAVAYTRMQRLSAGMADLDRSADRTTSKRLHPTLWVACTPSCAGYQGRRFQHHRRIFSTRSERGSGSSSGAGSNEGKASHVAASSASTPAFTGNRDKVQQQKGPLGKLLGVFGLQPLDEEDKPKVACEFVTQAIFNFMSCSAVAMAKMYGGSNALLVTGLIMVAHMVLLPIVIYTAGPISGAHFNPMVTSVFVATRLLNATTGACYIVAQCLGGILGAAGAYFSLPTSMQQVGFAGVQGVPMDHTVAQAFMGEIFASFFFIFVLFGMVIDKRGWGKFGPLAVALAIAFDMWVLGPVSSMCINPARALGPAVVSGYWDHHWIWWTAPFIGGLTAGKLYEKFWLPKEQLAGLIPKNVARHLKAK